MVATFLLFVCVGSAGQGAFGTRQGQVQTLAEETAAKSVVQLLPVSQAHQKRRRDAHQKQGLTVCNLVKNENLYVDEWLRFHQRMGFTNIILYDDWTAQRSQLRNIAKRHRSTLELFSPFPDALLQNFRKIEWMYPSKLIKKQVLAALRKCQQWQRNGRPGVKNGNSFVVCQRAAWADCTARFRRHSSWMSNHDVDEYFFPCNNTRIPSSRIIGSFVNDEGETVQELNSSYPNAHDEIEWEGTRVKSVMNGGKAARMGIHPGMQVQSIDEKPVIPARSSHAQLAQALRQGSVLTFSKPAEFTHTSLSSLLQKPQDNSCASFQLQCLRFGTSGIATARKSSESVLRTLTHRAPYVGLTEDLDAVATQRKCYADAKKRVLARSNGATIQEKSSRSQFRSALLACETTGSYKHLTRAGSLRRVLSPHRVVLFKGKGKECKAQESHETGICCNHYQFRSLEDLQTKARNNNNTLYLEKMHPDAVRFYNTVKDTRILSLIDADVRVVRRQIEAATSFGARQGDRMQLPDAEERPIQPDLEPVLEDQQRCQCTKGYGGAMYKFRSPCVQQFCRPPCTFVPPPAVLEPTRASFPGRSLRVVCPFHDGFWVRSLFVILQAQFATDAGLQYFVTFNSTRDGYYSASRGGSGWSPYFEEIGKQPLHESQVVELACNDNAKLFGYGGHSIYPANWTMATEIRSVRSNQVKKWVRPRREFRDKVTAFWNEAFAGKNLHVLGVHLRGTDIKKNKDKQTNLQRFFDMADAYISANKARGFRTKIYLGTDDEDYATAFRAHYVEGVVVSQPGTVIRGGTAGQLKGNAWKDRSKDGFTKGSQVLFDTLAFSKCDFLLKSKSAVSEFAIYFNLRLHKNSFDFRIKGQPLPVWMKTERVMPRTQNRHVLTTKYLLQSFQLPKVMRMNQLWKYYRLGDVWKTHVTKKSWMKQKQLYPGSLATKYMQNCQSASLATKSASKKSCKHNYGVLLGLVKSYKPELRPPRRSVIVHLRLGDIIENTKVSVAQFLAKDTKSRTVCGKQYCFGVWQGTQYLKPRSYFQAVAKRYIRVANRVILVPGLFQDADHFKTQKPRYDKSAEYTAEVASVFQRAGFAVELRIGNAPDDDFVWMCRGDYYVPSGGGFSELITSFNRLVHSRSVIAERGMQEHLRGPGKLQLYYSEASPKIKQKLCLHCGAGTHVSITTCDEGKKLAKTNVLWVFDPEMHQIKSEYSKLCLSGSKKRKEVGLERCEEGTPDKHTHTQRWDFNHRLGYYGEIKLWSSNLCLHVTAPTSTPTRASISALEIRLAECAMGSYWLFAVL